MKLLSALHEVIRAGVEFQRDAPAKEREREREGWREGEIDGGRDGGR